MHQKNKNGTRSANQNNFRPQLLSAHRLDGRDFFCLLNSAWLMENEVKSPSYAAIGDHDVWPTRSTDQTIAIEIIKRHSERFGYVKLLERAEVSEKDGGTLEVEFPPWLRELTMKFSELYGPELGHSIFEKTLRWLMREIFGGYAAVSLH